MINIIIVVIMLITLLLIIITNMANTQFYEKGKNNDNTGINYENKKKHKHIN